MPTKQSNKALMSGALPAGSGKATSATKPKASKASAGGPILTIAHMGEENIATVASVLDPSLDDLVNFVNIYGTDNIIALMERALMRKYPKAPRTVLKADVFDGSDGDEEGEDTIEEEEDIEDADEDVDEEDTEVGDEADTTPAKTPPKPALFNKADLIATPKIKSTPKTGKRRGRSPPMPSPLLSKSSSAKRRKTVA